ncbi:P-loop containing nucleoside triphosphate hydrolase protein [Phlyctochytrium arcticum]|nr:P-loop containing nucleoside triphosphate hydrolase protein [Phlyctochytrium arcticum]
MKKALKVVFRYDEFRDIQQPVIESVLANRDTVAVMRTSAGKTLLHAVPSALLFVDQSFTFTVIVYPLLSLIDNQMKELAAVGIPCAAITGQTKYREKEQVHVDIANRLLRCVLTTPEQVGYNNFDGLLKHVQRSGYQQIRFVIDEAHLAMEWDFRDYDRIKEVKNRYGSSVLLMSATLTRENAQELSDLFGLVDPRVMISVDLERPNIEYSISKKGTATFSQLIDEHVEKWNWVQQTGIIYCATPADTNDLFRIMSGMGNNAPNIYCVSKYHAKLGTDNRKASQKAWEQGDTTLMIATQAFGVGINHAHVRFVIHIKMPTTMGSFLQESGRAGRDGEPAKSLVIVSTGLQKRAAETIISDKRSNGVEEVPELTEEQIAEMRRKRRALKEVQIYFQDEIICCRAYHAYFFHPQQFTKLEAGRCLSATYRAQYPTALPCSNCGHGVPLNHLQEISVMADIEGLRKLTEDLCSLAESYQRSGGRPFNVTPVLLKEIFCQSSAMER